MLREIIIKEQQCSELNTIRPVPVLPSYTHVQRINSCSKHISYLVEGDDFLLQVVFRTFRISLNVSRSIGFRRTHPKKNLNVAQGSRESDAKEIEVVHRTVKESL